MQWLASPVTVRPSNAQIFALLSASDNKNCKNLNMNVARA